MFYCSALVPKPVLFDGDAPAGSDGFISSFLQPSQFVSYRDTRETKHVRYARELFKSPSW